MVDITFRLGRSEDAEAIAVLFDMANAGLIEALMSLQAQGDESWLDITTRMVTDPNSEIHFGNTLIASVDNKVAGALICVQQPPILPEIDFDKLPDNELPFAYLRSRVPGGFLLRDMAVFPEFRTMGIATRLLDLAIASAYSMQFDTVFAIVHESNTKLLAHYAKRGLTVIDEHKALEHPAYAPDSKWLLLTCHKPNGIVSFAYSEPPASH